METARKGRGMRICPKDCSAVARSEYFARGYATLKYFFVFYTEKSWMPVDFEPYIHSSHLLIIKDTRHY